MNKKIKIAYFGAPDFSASVLQKIKDDLSDTIEVCSVFTQPDKPAGRKQIPTSTPVKIFAQKENVPVFEDLNNIDVLLKDVDLVLLYAYGAILPEKVLKIPLWGFWNIHPSLLPLYRGTSPIVYSLLLGDKKTGVSLMEMDSRMDHGKIIEQEEYIIQPTDTQDTLKKSLSDIGYKLFKKNIQLLLNGSLQKKEQNHSKATFTRLLTKNNGFLPYPIVQKILRREQVAKDELPSLISEYFARYGVPLHFNFDHAIFNMFRALSPWPGLWTMIPFKEGEKRLKITGVELKNDKPIITKVQLEGKKEVIFETFKRAYLLP